MKWKYYIPHIWDRERQIWEDVYLLPCHPEYHGESIWLTIDALGEKSEDASDQEEYQTLLEKLGDNTYHLKIAINF